MNAKNSTAPRIYVASLADYNAGRLHGVWIDLDGKDVEEINEEIQGMLRESKYPNTYVGCPVCSDPHEPQAECHNARCQGGEVPSAEEWAIHDYEGFEGLSVSEFDSLERISKIAQMLSEYGRAFAAWVGNGSEIGLDPDEWREAFLEAYRGKYESLEEYARELLEEIGDLDAIPERLRFYFDFAQYGREMVTGGDIWVHEEGYGKVHIFSNL